MGTPTADPYVALADELGRLGRRLDGMGAELLRLRAAAGAAPLPGGEAAPWSRSEDVRPGAQVASSGETAAAPASPAVTPRGESAGHQGWAPPTGWSQHGGGWAPPAAPGAWPGHGGPQPGYGAPGYGTP